MRLVLDAGNTDTVFGLHDGQQWLHTWRTRSLTDEPPSHYEQKIRLWLLEAGLSAAGIRQTVLSSVVPDLTPTLRLVLLALTGAEPVVVGPAIYAHLPLLVLRPYEIGTDLVANAMAAHSLFRRNCVVVDFGTALSFTTVAASGEIVGVAITTGLRTAVRALFANTAQLPEVPLEMPSSALGKNTTEAIQAGVVLGYEGLVRSLVNRICTELDGDCLVVATGGLVSAIPTLHPVFDHIRPTLTLDGLVAIGALVPATA